MAPLSRAPVEENRAARLAEAPLPGGDEIAGRRILAPAASRKQPGHDLRAF